MKKANKHSWRFEKELDPQEVLDRLTVGELYLLVHSCHPSIWESFVRHKGLSHASRRELMERVKRAVQESFSRSSLLLSDCIAQVQKPLIEKTGLLLQACELEQQLKQENKLQRHALALKDFLPLMSPLALLKNENDNEDPEYVQFHKEKPIDLLTSAEQKNCLFCLEFVSCIDKGTRKSHLIRIVKTRTFQIKLVCKRRHVPSRYLSNALACAMVARIMKQPQRKVLSILFQYLFASLVKLPKRPKEQKEMPRVKKLLKKQKEEEEEETDQDEEEDEQEEADEDEEEEILSN